MCDSIGIICHSQNAERKLFSISVRIVTGFENIRYSRSLGFQQVSLGQNVSLVCFQPRKVIYLG